MRTSVLLMAIFIVCIFQYGESIADNWNVGPGGKPGRYSLSSETGPEAPVLLWQGGQPAVIAQQAVIDGNVLAMSRIFNLNDVLHGTLIVAHDLQTGDTLWTADLPVDFPASDWRNRVSAIRDGVVYATRAGNTNYSYMYALDAQTGVILWKSEGTVNESSTEGASFASNGDLVVGNFDSVIRINANNGNTVWETSRSCPTSNGQEVAIYGNRGYYWEPSPGGPKVSVIDIETGQYLYSSDALSPGYIQQLGLFTGPDGTVYAPRTMNNPATDFLFALTDNGSGMDIKWSIPMGYVPFSTSGIGPDGTVYCYNTAGGVMAIDPNNGAIIHDSQTIFTATSASPRMGIDAQGYIFVTNGEFSTGEFYSFNPDLSLRWSENIQNVNVGGPAIGQNGTLVICGVGTDVRAYEGSYCLIADFSATPAEVCEGDPVQFTDLSSGNILSWDWHFEGGTPETSQEQNPLVHYETAGAYDVSLIIHDGSGYDTTYKTDYITVNPLPDVVFDTLPEFCLDDPPYLLTEGSPEGGTYSGPGVQDGYFHPDVAGTGNHVLTYSYTDPNGCSSSAEQTATVEECTGMDDQIVEDSPVQVFPNPAGSLVNLSFLTANFCDLRFGITPLSGKTKLIEKHATVAPGKHVFEINTSELDPGVYIIRICGLEETPIIRKMIITP